MADKGIGFPPKKKLQTFVEPSRPCEYSLLVDEGACDVTDTRAADELPPPFDCESPPVSTLLLLVLPDTSSPCSSTLFLLNSPVARLHNSPVLAENVNFIGEVSVVLRTGVPGEAP